MAKFPKETGGGWYELSDGTKVQGQEEAEKAEQDLKGSGSKGSGPKGESAVGQRVDDGTGLESLAVDRETGGDSVGGKIGDDEDDPRRFTPVAGMEIVGEAESGEPIVAGGVPTMTSGVPADAAGVNDPTLTVAPTVAHALAEHEGTRDQWGAGSLDRDSDAYDGSPADRVKAGLPQNPTEGGTATQDDDKYTS